MKEKDQKCTHCFQVYRFNVPQPILSWCPRCFKESRAKNKVMKISKVEPLKESKS